MADRILLSPPEVGPDEREALLGAFDSGWIAPVGPNLEAFEAELCSYTGAEACVALSSGTAGLHLSLLVLGVQPGDEVVVQSATFGASAFAVCHAGATPVFCDIDPVTWCIDPRLVARLFDQRLSSGRPLPRAVMSVDLYGSCPDYRELRAVCDRYDVPVLEDAAEALGSRMGDRMAGTFGDIGVFSFNGNKIITTSGGGAAVGPREQIERIRYLATQARQPVLHYEHVDVGFNYRLSNLLAALGSAQLAWIDAKVAARRRVNQTYRHALPQIEWPSFAAELEPNHWLSVGLLPAGVEPAAFCMALDRAGIEARPTWKPMHQQPVFEAAESIGGSVADRVYQQGICLPSGSNLSPCELDRVIAAVGDVLV